MSALLAASLLACGPAEPVERPNIVLISLDTFRADRMRAYGGTSGLTPTLDALAENGTLFAHAVVSSGTTFPSHATMLTGLYPRAHGVRSNFARLPDAVPTVAEQLERAGYASGAFVSHKSMLFHGRLGRGFDAVSDSERSDRAVRDGLETARLALAWLEQRREAERPFFLWYHNYDAHSPFRMTPHARAALERMGYSGPFQDGASVAEITQHQREIVESSEQLAAVRALYDGEVIAADRAVAALIDGLAELELLQKSVVILIADHGQALGEHTWFGHGPALWETVLHTPLVVVDYRQPARRVVEQTVGAVDVAPTILELARAEPLPGPGRSLVSALSGAELTARDYYAEVELRKEESRGAWYDPDALALYGGGYKLIRRKGKSRLYDLERDPSAAEPVARPGPSERAARERLLGLADDYLREAVAASAAAPDVQTAEQLRALGYVE